MRLNRALGAAIGCGLLAAAPTQAFNIRYEISDTGAYGILSFDYAGSNQAATSAFSYYSAPDTGEFGWADAGGDLLADWTITENKFKINTRGQVLAAIFSATSADGSEMLKLNFNGENTASGHFYDNPDTAYIVSNDSGFAGVSFFFNASSSMMPTLSVPEPSTWLTLTLGFFAIGTLRYRSLARSRARPI